MFKDLVQKIWSMRVQFAKYFTIGVGAVVLDIWSLHLLVKLGFGPTSSIILNQLVIVNLVFMLNKYWSFSAKGITHEQVIKFYLVAGLNYLFAIGWMWFFTNIFNLHQYLDSVGASQNSYYLAVRLVNVALAVSWNFLLYKFFVYRVVVSESVNKHPLD